MEIRKLTLDDPTYPAVLRNIPAPPQQIYVRGELESLLARPRLAVIGSRKATDYGYQVTTKLVSELVGYGVVIVSGLALGIDGIAHQAALDNGGLTLAVVGSGLDQVTPATNQPLAKQILKQQGAIISEYAPGVKPYRYSFVARNRLISGLSDALLVTEAAIASGTHHTVDAANAQGKTVMAVPANIDSETSAGTNQLIKDGASVVTEVADILEELGLTYTQPTQTELLGRNPEETAILQVIRSGEHSVGAILEKSGLGISVFNQTLTMLELARRIESKGGGHWTLR